MESFVFLIDACRDSFLSVVASSLRAGWPDLRDRNAHFWSLKSGMVFFNVKLRFFYQNVSLFSIENWLETRGCSWQDLRDRNGHFWSLKSCMRRKDHRFMVFINVVTFFTKNMKLSSIDNWLETRGCSWQDLRDHKGAFWSLQSCMRRKDHRFMVFINVKLRFLPKIWSYLVLITVLKRVGLVDKTWGTKTVHLVP